MKHYKDFAACLKKPKSLDKIKPILGETRKRNKSVRWRDPLVEEYLFYPYKHEEETINEDYGPRINNETCQKPLLELSDLPSPVKRSNESERDYHTGKNNKDCADATCETDKDGLTIYPRCPLTEQKDNRIRMDYREQQDVSPRFDRNLPAQMQKVSILEETDYESKRYSDIREKREYLREKMLELEGDWV